MTAAVQQLLPELNRLPKPDRAAIALAMIESLDGETDEGYEEAWDEELARRAESIDNGTAVGVPADEVLARLRQLYP